MAFVVALSLHSCDSRACAANVSAHEWLAGALLMMVASLAAAADAGYPIYGKVMGAQRLPIRGAVVSVLGAAQTPIFGTRSDSSGEFRLHLESGVYELSAVCKLETHVQAPTHGRRRVVR